MTKKTAVPTPPAVPAIPSVPESTTPAIPVTETPVIVATPELLVQPVALPSVLEETPPAVPELQESYPDDLEDGQLRVRHKTNRQVFIVAQDYYDVHQGVLELVQ